MILKCTLVKLGEHIFELVHLINDPITTNNKLRCGNN